MNMRGKECNAVVYSEYSGDTVFNEQDRCIMDNVTKEMSKDWNVCTFAKEETEVKLDMKAVKKGWEAIERENLLQTVWTASQINKLGLKNKSKGEKELLKIIIKNKETGWQKCIDIPKDRENDDVIKRLKVGSLGLVYPKRAGRATFTKKYLDNLIQQNEAREERKKYRERPYFNVKLDLILGKSDGEENLEKIKFPCWVTYKHKEDGKHRIGMLVTGNPNRTLEYQLIDMMETVDVEDCCTLYRDTDLEELMKRCYIEIIKGETQLWRVGKFNV